MIQLSSHKNGNSECLTLKKIRNKKTEKKNKWKKVENLTEDLRTRRNSTWRNSKNKVLYRQVEKISNAAHKARLKVCRQFGVLNNSRLTKNTFNYKKKKNYYKMSRVNKKNVVKFLMNPIEIWIKTLKI